MSLVDGNLLLYAYNPRAVEHPAARAWLERALSGREPIWFAWTTLWAFVRISTNARVFERPMSVDEASGHVASWLAQPVAGILDPGERHWEIFAQVARHGQAAGALASDAALAAIAIEHGAELLTTDRDFARFEGLRWRNPIAEKHPRR